MQQGHKPPVDALIDFTSIPGLNRIEQADDQIIVGAAATHTQIVASVLLVQQATCLVESCGVIGGPQVRNVATLGGNVAHALPAADGTTSLVALDAEVELASPEGIRWYPILDMFSGPGRPSFDPTRSLITRFRFPLTTDSGTAFSRIMRPQGVALPILACAVWVQMAAGDPDIIGDTRISLGPVQPVPARAVAAENTLRGRQLKEALDDCVAAARQSLQPRSSKHRATSTYRVEMIETFLRRTLPLAVERAISGEVTPQGLGW
jgi:carbon-monoxide dehydrogenase medium subunit